MTTTPLERLYPNRCFDCLQPIPMHKAICDKCQAVYDEVRRRRASREAERKTCRINICFDGRLVAGSSAGQTCKACNGTGLEAKP